MVNPIFNNLKTVAHFLRKNSQLRASFIQNQILNHIAFKSVVIYRYQSNKDNSGFAEYPKDLVQLNLACNKKIDINFRYLKKISRRDTERVLDYIDQNNVKILHLHYGSDAYIYSDIIKYSKLPSVVSFYGYDCFSYPKLYFGSGKKWLNESVFPFATKIIAMTQEMKNDLMSFGCPEEKIVIHYHGVPSKLFFGIKKTYNQVNQKFRLLNISYFDPVKGHLFIFKALKELVENGFREIELRIIGTGTYRTELKKYVKENNLDAYISFLAPIKYAAKEMLDEIANADTFIHPSVTTKHDKEGIPGAVVEAMFAGLPVISTYHGGIPYIIKNNETGLLCNEWDVKGLSENIKSLISNVKLREKLGKRGQTYAVHNLDLTKKQVDLEKIYFSLLK